MYLANFELDSFEIVPVEERCALVLALCDALTAIDRAFLRRVGANVPGLYESGVRYKNQTWGLDKWKDIPRLLATGTGACEDLASWRVAELHVKEGERSAFIDVDTFPTSDGIVYHVVVVRPTKGLREDPSAFLGMNSVTG